jgi:hypothetical protein
MQLALVGTRPDLLAIAESVCQLNQLLLVTPELAVARAVALAKDPTPEDKEAMEISPTLQALGELGQRYLAITTDPKNPMPASEDLTMDMTVAYARACGAAQGDWLLAGCPATDLQARLLERALTGYTDPQVEEYLEQVRKSMKGKKQAPPPRRASKAKAVDPGLLDPNAPLRKVSGFDAVFKIGLPSVDGEVDPLSAFWEQFEDPSGRTFCYALREGDTATSDLVLDSVDILVELVGEQKLQAEKEAERLLAEQQAAAPTGAGDVAPKDGKGPAPGTAPQQAPSPAPSPLPSPAVTQKRTSTKGWKAKVVKRREARRNQLPPAGQMWHQHAMGERLLDVAALKAEIIDSWDLSSGKHARDVHRALTKVVASVKPLRSLEKSRCRSLACLVHSPIEAFQQICAGACAELQRRKSAWDAFCNDLEVSLGDAVEERYREAMRLVEDTGVQAGEEAQAALRNAEAALEALAAAEWKRLESTLRLVLDFDRLSNISTVLAPEARADNGGANVPALHEAKAEVLRGLQEVPLGAFGQRVEAAVGSLDGLLQKYLARPLSLEAASHVERALLDHLIMLQRTAAFFGRLRIRLTAGADDMVTTLRGQVRERTNQQHARVATLMKQLHSVGAKGAPRLLKDGHKLLQVDESTRAPAAVGVTMVSSGTAYLPPAGLSALIYNLRAKAARSATLSRESFVRCVLDAAAKNKLAPAWQNPERVAGVAARLDPLGLGVVSWRRFVHAAICALLPRAPTLEELLRTRAAAVRRKVRAGEGREAVAMPLAPLRVTANEFLDLPLWFEEEVEPAWARSIKELYALAFTDDDGRVSLLSLLLALCEGALDERDLTWTRELGAPHTPLLRALVLLGRGLGPEEGEVAEATRAFALRAGDSPAKSPLVSAKVLEHVLCHGTSLYTPEAAYSWLDTFCAREGLDRAAELPLQTLVTSPALQLEFSSGGLMTVADVYM